MVCFSGMWILIGIAFVILLSFAYAAMSGAPWVPTWKRDIDRAADLLDLKEGERFYELGCGDGRVCLNFAKRSGANVTGIELSILQWFVANVRKLVSGSSARFRLANAFSVDLSDADALYVFLMPDTYKKIKPKLERELKKGTRVVTYVWPIPGWNPAYVDRVEGSSDLYLYVR